MGLQNSIEHDFHHRLTNLWHDLNSEVLALNIVDSNLGQVSRQRNHHRLEQNVLQPVEVLGIDIVHKD